MASVTDITSGKGRNRGVRSKKEALEKLGAKDDQDDGFTAGKENTNIRKPEAAGEEKPQRRTHRPKQQKLAADFETEIHPSVTKAGEDYLEVLDERMRLQQQEPKLRQGLIDLMIHHNVPEVTINSEKLTLKTLHKVQKSTVKDGE
jgi:hypothetical protein